jgi:peptidoglycan/LPS O-acetylase OafA/YrhL
MRDALRKRFADVTRREWILLVAAMAVSFVVVVAYVVIRRHHPLVRDQLEYDMQGRFFTEGHFWWSTTPFGVAHASAWKAPLYPAWVGFWYEILGTSAFRVELVQAFLAPLTVFLTWLLARRLFNPVTAIVAALVVAVFPLAWEYYGLFFPEALAVPMTMVVLLLFIEREPTPKRAALVGAAVGVSLLIRPTAFFLLAGVLAAWVIAAGWRRGVLMTALATGVAILVVAPWTIRNAVVTDGGFIPISAQDGAVYGTFNSDAANDPRYPWAWRPVISNPPAVLTGPPVDDATLRSKLESFALDYIKAHPFSVAEAFYWNGLTRLWDIRRPSNALAAVPFEGRSRAATIVGLGMYYLLLPLALIALYRERRRRSLVIPVLVLALAASVAFLAVSGTRYRAPFEPLIVILAASTLVGWAGAGRLRRLLDPDAPPAPAAGAEAAGPPEPPAGGPRDDTPTISQAGEVRSSRVESLRALAALAVLWSHVLLTSLAVVAVVPGGGGGTLIQKLVYGGGFAVYFFFALTGYLLFWPFVKRDFAGGAPIDLGRYAMNRALRILPLYYVVVVVGLLVLHSGSPLGYWARFLTFSENFDPATAGKIVGPAWSLVVELHFYLLLPFIAWGIARIASGSRIRAALALVALAAVSLAFRATHVLGTGSPPDPLWRLNLPATFLFFVPGMLLALLRTSWDQRRPGWVRGPLASSDLWLLAGVPLWAIVSLVSFRVDPLLAVASFLIVGACVLPLQMGPFTRALGWRPLAALGVASYSLYLWHVPIIEAVTKWIDSAPSFTVLALISVPASIAIAFASYRWVEAPFLRLRRQWTTSAAVKEPAPPLEPAPPPAAVR